MRGSAAVLLALVGCFHPTAATDVPCSADGSCPTGQTCDLARSPPQCVAGQADAGQVTGGSSDASQATDAPFAPPDASHAHDGGPIISPIEFAQAASNKPTEAVTTLALPHSVGAGAAIVVCLDYPSESGATLVSITDSLSNTYSVLVGPLTANGTDHYVAASDGSHAGDDTLTLTMSAATVKASDLFALEYGGIVANDAFDVSAELSGTGVAMSSGPATTTHANELVIGFAEASAATAGTGFTSRITQSGNMVEDMTAATAGSYDATAADSDGAWTMILVALRGH